MRAKPDNCDPDCATQQQTLAVQRCALAAKLASKNSAGFMAVFKPDNSISDSRLAAPKTMLYGVVVILQRFPFHLEIAAVSLLARIFERAIRIVPDQIHRLLHRA